MTWAYATPLEQPSCALDPRVIEINGMPFQMRADCRYFRSYYELADMMDAADKLSPEERKANPAIHRANYIRHAILDDLWFFVYFIMKNPLANHPFVVEACYEVQRQKQDTLYVWARDHLKTSIISVGETCRQLLKDPERRFCIFSAVRPLGVKILQLIRSLFEDELLIKCFPDVLYAEPWKESPSWTLAPEGGITVKRKGFFKEPSVTAFGLIEGMPTGDHYTDLIFDDIVTQDQQTPEIIAKVKENFDQAENLGTRDRRIKVVGTYYRHDDPLVYVGTKQDPVTKKKLFKISKKTATVDGTMSGASVFLPEETLARKRGGKRYIFNCQQLLNPTPEGTQALNGARLKRVNKKDLPAGGLYRFMLVDGAGDRGRRVDRAADCWALGVIGVQPYLDDRGNSSIYILDLQIEEMGLKDAQKAIVDMYSRWGRILKLGVEKVGMSTTEVHVENALKARGKYVNRDNGRLHILNPAGRSKETRIESALAGPLDDGKWHYLDTVKTKYIERLLEEMEKFPAWKDDGIDMCSYIYDLIHEYRFPVSPDAIEVDGRPVKPKSAYDEAFAKARARPSGGWMGR